MRVAAPASDDCWMCELPLGTLRDSVKTRRGRAHRACWMAAHE